MKVVFIIAMSIFCAGMGPVMIAHSAEKKRATAEGQALCLFKDGRIVKCKRFTPVEKRGLWT